MSSAPPLRVAIVGAGVGGLGAAYTLSRNPAVHLTVYEARDVLGGHANTVEVKGFDGPIDTGFLVYNEVRRAVPAAARGGARRRARPLTALPSAPLRRCAEHVPQPRRPL
jgi:cation diffusion facilitator CzcD-associated flavoprotein CzcO